MVRCRSLNRDEAHRLRDLSFGFNTFLPIDRSNMIFMHVNTFQSQHVISEGDLNSTFLPPFRSELNSQKRQLRLQPR